MTQIQEKLLTAIKLLVEIRELAKMQGEKFREEHNLPIARYYERLASELGDNVALSLSGIQRHVEGNPPERPVELNLGVVKKSAEFMFRRDLKLIKNW